MSLEEINTKKENPDKKLEQNLQSIVNDLTSAMEFLNFDSKILEKFEDVFKNSNTLNEIVAAICLMFKKFVKNIKLLNLKQQQTKSSSILDQSIDKKVSDSNYQNLEKVLQKYEAEIRDHIRIEQQLKIYTESLEDKIEKFNKKKIIKEESILHISELNKKFKKKNEKLKLENRQLENKLNNILKRKRSLVEKGQNNSFNKQNEIKAKVLKPHAHKLFRKPNFSMQKIKKQLSQKKTLRNNDFILNFKKSYKDLSKSKNDTNKIKNRLSSYSQKILT